MFIRDMVGSCFEMAQAESHPFPRHVQLRMPGEKNKLIGLLRYLPPRTIKIICGIVQSNTLPFKDKIENPLAYGGESVVYKIPGNSKKTTVVKLLHAKELTSTTIQKHRFNQELFEKYFGDMVLKHHLLQFESQYGSKLKRVAAIQPYFEGSCLFEVALRTNPESLTRLARGIMEMSMNEGLIPDLAGHGNILVDENGEIRIVDTGYMVPTDNITNPVVEERFHWLEDVYSTAA